MFCHTWAPAVSPEAMFHVTAFYFECSSAIHFYQINLVSWMNNDQSKLRKYKLIGRIYQISLQYNRILPTWCEMWSLTVCFLLNCRVGFRISKRKVYQKCLFYAWVIDIKCERKNPACCELHGSRNEKFWHVIVLNSKFVQTKLVVGLYAFLNIDNKTRVGGFDISVYDWVIFVLNISIMFFHMLLGKFEISPWFSKKYAKLEFCGSYISIDGQLRLYTVDAR